MSQRYICGLLKHRIGVFFMLSTLSTVMSAQNKISTPAIDSLIIVLEKTRIDSNRLKLLNDLAWKELWLGIPNDDVVSKYTNEALVLAKKLNNKYQEGLALHTRGHLLKRQGKLSEAMKNFFSILKLSEEINDRDCFANQHLNIGSVYFAQGNIAKAVEYHLAAVKIWSELGDKQKIFRCYNSIAGIYLGSNFNEEAIKYFLLAREVAQELDNKPSIASTYISLGNANKNIGNYVEAKKCYFAALENMDPLANIIGDCYIGLGWVCFLEAALGKTSTPNESYSTALDYFQKALRRGQEARVRWFITEAYTGLAETYKKLDNYKKALEYTTLRYQLKDSVYRWDVYEKMQGMKTQYESEKEQIRAQARQDVFLARDSALKEKILNEQRLEQQRMLTEERLAHENQIAQQKMLAEERLAHESQIAQQKFDKSIGIERVRQEMMKAEQERNTTLILFGVGALIITTIFLIVLFRQRSEKKQAIERAEAIQKMTNLELQSLRAQLNPHFMFNSLNAIQELILKEDNDNSHLYLSRFSDLLRMLLDHANQPFIPLRKELVFLELYLSLEKLRIPNLEYSFCIEENVDPENVMIPNMMLQPYIENAIWHGLSNKKNNRALHVRIRHVSNTIIFEIEDNGVGRKKAKELKELYGKNHKSKGMELLSKRFSLLSKQYGTTIEIKITDLIVNNDEPAGTLVKLTMPYSLTEKETELIYDQNYYN